MPQAALYGAAAAAALVGRDCRTQAQAAAAVALVRFREMAASRERMARTAASMVRRVRRPQAALAVQEVRTETAEQAAGQVLPVPTLVLYRDPAGMPETQSMV